MAGRLEMMFEDLKGRRAALIAYATGFYPDREMSERIMRTLLESGADALEIGIPFSDPVMDGPVIQATSNAALEAGATPAAILEMVSSLRRDTEKPLLAMTYYNLVFRRGLERFARESAAAGLDAVVIPDLPVEEMGPWKQACDSAGIDTVAFCSVTTSPERIEACSAMTTGFLYCVALLGTTGVRDSLSEDLPAFLERVRSHASCPLAVGLGISTPEQCADVGRLADGVIVGSAFMREVSEADGGLSGLAELVSSMAGALSGSA